METTCSMVGCYNTTDNESMYNFYPFPKDFDLCMLWVQNCGRAELFEDFAYGGAQPFIHRILCSAHFNTSDFNDADCLNKGLKPGAIPILHEPPLVIVKQEFEELADDSLDDDISELGAPGDQIESLIKHESLEKGMENRYSTNEFRESVEQSSREDLEQDKLLEEPYLPLLVISSDKVLFKDKGANLSQKSQKAFQTAWKRALESAEQRDARNRANALRNAFRRTNETREQRRARNQANALRNASRRANETEDQRKDRLYKNAVRAALRRSMESEDEQKERRRKNAMRAACRRSAETEEQRAERRLKDKIRSAERRKRETDLQAKLRRYNDAVRAAFRRSNETEEQRQQRRMYDVMRAARRRTNETDEQRMKRLQADRERAARRRLMKKLHQSVANVQNTFFDQDLAPYLDYDTSCSSSAKADSSHRRCTSDGWANDSSEDSLSNHSHTFSESESLGNTNIGEFSDNNNFSNVGNRCSTNNEVPDFYNNVSSDINITSFPDVDIHTSSDKMKPRTVVVEQSADAATAPEVVWCA